MNLTIESTCVSDPKTPAPSTIEIISSKIESNSNELKNIGFYRREIMPFLGAEVFELNPLRLGWFAACVSVAVFGFYAIVALELPWFAKLAIGITIGLANGILGFVTHELLHGSIVKNERLQNALGFFGLMPFLISPTYWRFVHNRLHHGKTQQTIRDPDAFPTLRIYKSSKFVQTIFPYTPGSGHKRSALYFFFWLSFHEFVAQIYLRFRNGVFAGMNHRKVSIELALQMAIMGAAAIYAGPANWLWVIVLPIAAQNYLLVSYIATNHNLSPLTSENDPLVNSLTVTNHPVVEFFTLNFGYHVEHHLFPTVSPRHAKKIHVALLKKFPESFKVMSKWKAMKALYSTPRIYKSANVLVHPETMQTFDTI
ncbi:MAG: fatty acid desaturase [Deltaproteobacteria bacterium]|nr:fatty acid desaturase [Deltaproteobacteria bacterium]